MERERANESDECKRERKREKINKLNRKKPKKEENAFF
jgi:hypothetical protein